MNLYDSFHRGMAGLRSRWTAREGWGATGERGGMEKEVPVWAAPSGLANRASGRVQFIIGAVPIALRR